MTSTIPLQFWVQLFASIILRCVWEHSMRFLDPIYPTSRGIMLLICLAVTAWFIDFLPHFTNSTTEKPPCNSAKLSTPTAIPSPAGVCGLKNLFGLVEPCSNLQHGSTSITNQFGFISTQWTIGRFKQPPQNCPEQGCQRYLQSLFDLDSLVTSFFRGPLKLISFSSQNFLSSQKSRQPRLLILSDSRQKSLLFIRIMLQHQLLGAMDFYLSKTMKRNGASLKEWRIDSGIDLV